MLVALLLGAAVLIQLPTVAASGAEPPKATEVGVSADEIHIAVIADVDNPFAPGAFKGAELGVEGAAKYLDSKAGGGGVAGRKLVVDFIDSHLNGTETRNAIIKACESDFAMVGTAAIFVSNVTDQVNCKDQSGATTGLVDLAGFAAGITQSCSPDTFPVTGVQIDCSTVSQAPQTYHVGAGGQKYLVKKFGTNKLHGAYVPDNDTKDALVSSNTLIEAHVQAGIKADQNTPVSASAPQSAYTPIVAKMKQDGSTYGEAISDQLMINLRSEAQLQGLPSSIVWSCETCYSKKSAASAALDGTWVDVPYLPVEDATANPMVKTFLRYVGQANADQYAVYGWAATLAFADAAKAIVGKQGVNGLTRKALLSEGVPSLTAFNASGMIGTTNIADKRTSPCFVELRLQGGKYQRVYPSRKGTLDCAASNEETVKADLLSQ